MKVLLVKLTSMGDLIHALPAITDAARAIPGISFDWVIEKNFSEVALWHPAVKTIIPTSHRKWRKNIWQSIKGGEIRQFFSALRKEKYDLVLDGQANSKSALIMMLSRGLRCGLDKNSVREWAAHLTYQKTFAVDKDMHAVKRLRLLFSQALNYTYIDDQPDYGIANCLFPPLKFTLPKPYLVFVHNASWTSKMTPEGHWQELIKLAAAENYQVVLPWGNAAEKERAERLVAGYPNAQVLPFCSLSEQAQILKGAVGAICSDTGLAHLAAALNVPAVTLYGSTDPKLIGTLGLHQQHLMATFPCIMCYQYNCNYKQQAHAESQCLVAMKPELIWETFKSNLANSLN